MGGAAYGWLRRGGGLLVLAKLSADNRGSVYSALATIFGALLGFSVTALAIVIAASDQRAIVLLKGKPKAYADLWWVFKASIFSLGGATIASVLALVLDRGNQPRDWVMGAVVAA